MGLASYGELKTYEATFRSGFRLLADGKYEIASSGEWMKHFADADFLEHIRRTGEAITQAHMDFASALQHTLETIVLHVLEFF